MGFIATSMVSWSGILVKRLVTSQERKKISERFSLLIWEKKKVLRVKEDRNKNGQDYNRK